MDRKTRQWIRLGFSLEQYKNLVAWSSCRGVSKRKVKLRRGRIIPRCIAAQCKEGWEKQGSVRSPQMLQPSTRLRLRPASGDITPASEQCSYLRTKLLAGRKLWNSKLYALNRSSWDNTSGNSDRNARQLLVFSIHYTDNRVLNKERK